MGDKDMVRKYKYWDRPVKICSIETRAKHVLCDTTTTTTTTTTTGSIEASQAWLAGQMNDDKAKFTFHKSSQIFQIHKRMRRETKSRESITLYHARMKKLHQISLSLSQNENENESSRS